MKILFIGATGLVGKNTATILKDKYAITPAAIDGGEVAGMPVRKLDICDWDNTTEVINKGTDNGEPFDTIIYCATANFRDLNRTDAECMRVYYENCIEVNVRGTYHVFEAARRANISRIIHIGSMTAMLGNPHYEYIDADTRDRPNDLYAATKIFGENVGRSYAFPNPRWGNPMNVICLRLGQPTVEDEEITLKWLRRKEGCGIAADVRDIALAMERGLLTDVQYGVYPVVSAADKPFIDPATYSELGYTPQWKYDYTEENGVEISPV